MENDDRGTRFTCRDRNGKARIIEGYGLMEAIEKLCRIEERAFGVMIAQPTELQKATAEGQRIRRAEERKRKTEPSACAE